MTTETPAAQDGELIQCRITDSFAQWMSGCGGSIAITTYQAGKVALVGCDGRQVTLLMRQFAKPLGLAVKGANLALATRNEVILFANAPLLAHDYLEHQRGKYDALYLPRCSYHTGDLNAHDLAYADDGLWVVNTRFCCLAALSADHSFIPRWKPPFISEVVPEDRCHLNGLAVVDGKPKYVTCLGTTDTVGGWRADKAAGGVIVGVDSSEIILRGLSMPHSPRWHDGRLWVLNSGRGELWTVDPRDGKHTVVCGLPGYLRGLGFVGNYALVGMCMIREKHIFGGLPVQQKNARLLCGIAIIDLRTGQNSGMIEFTSGCQELYEVAFIPGIRRPMILNLEKEAARQAFTAPAFSYWLRPSNEIKSL